MKNQIRIAYLSTYDALNIKKWSGLGHYIFKTLDRYVGRTELIEGNKGRKLTNRLIKYFFRARKIDYDPERSINISKKIALDFEKKIKGKNFDIIFSPGTIPLTYLDVKLPMFFWTDATFASIINYYSFNISKKNLIDGNIMEKMALERSSLAFYSSHWAANSAINDYEIDPKKVKVVPFGANMSDIPNYDETQRVSNKKISLLFVGKEWERKGGDIAIDTFFEIKKAGYSCELIIVGSTVPNGTKDSDIKVYEYLDKSNDSDKKKLYDLYTKADFFLLPTRQECYGVVFCEANAFGLPIITTNTGGIPTIVQDGINGYKLTLEATGKEFAEKIIEIYKQHELYKKMRFESRKRYDELLNWDSAGKQIQEHICNYMDR